MGIIFLKKTKPPPLQEHPEALLARQVHQAAPARHGRGLCPEGTVPRPPLHPQEGTRRGIAGNVNPLVPRKPK